MSVAGRCGCWEGILSEIMDFTLNEWLMGPLNIHTTVRVVVRVDATGQENLKTK